MSTEICLTEYYSIVTNPTHIESGNALVETSRKKIFDIIQRGNNQGQFYVDRIAQYTEEHEGEVLALLGFVTAPNYKVGSRFQNDALGSVLSHDIKGRCMKLVWAGRFLRDMGELELFTGLSALRLLCNIEDERGVVDSGSADKLY